MYISQNNKIMASSLSEGSVAGASEEFLKFEVHIVDHCNLNCKGCGHFSPISAPIYLQLKDFQQDLERIRVLFNNNIRLINLLGGEPLLHPDLPDFFYIARAIFPYTNISLLTNGLTLIKMSNHFWKAVRVNEIQIEVTRYPIKFNYDEIFKLAKNKKVKFKFFGSTGRSARTFYHLPLDLSGSQNEGLSYSGCYMANDCVALKNGKLYPCPVAAYAYKMNETYGTHLINMDSDCINIYEAESAESILKFLSHPIPFCRYCDIEKRTKGHIWMPSARKISEWTITKEGMNYGADISKSDN